MNPGQYSVSLEKMKQMLNKYRLAKQFLPTKNPLSGAFLSATHEADPIKIYQNAIENFDYNVLLYDESIMQFSCLRTGKNCINLRYAYYEFPYDFPTYENYIKAYDYDYHSVGETFRESYEQELAEARPKKHFLALRYDFCEETYRTAAHPASHFHIGYNNTIKIPVSKIVSPFLFSIFVIKQCYYDKWSKLIEDESFSKDISILKTSCASLNPRVFAISDKQELYLE